MNKTKTDFQQGLQAAHDYLMGTASDFLEMASHIGSPSGTLKASIHTKTSLKFTPNELRERDSFLSKAQLLKGQAAHVLKIKQP